MLNGHVDVVPVGDPAAWTTPDPFSGRVVDGELHGRGSCDMKAGLVAALAAVTAVRRAGRAAARRPAARLRAGRGGRRARHVRDAAPRLDGGRLRGPRADQPRPGDGQRRRAHLPAHGARPRHARLPAYRRVSAIEKLVPVLAALRPARGRRNRDVDPLMARWPLAYPLSIGRVQAGDWASSVPDLLVAEGRLGVALDEPVEDARAALEQAVAEVSADDPWLRDHPVTRAVVGRPVRVRPAARRQRPRRADVGRAHRSRRQRYAGTLGAPYGCDLRLLAGGGIPTLHYGPGDAVLAHAPDERVPLAEVHTAARALAMLALDVTAALA